jgi:seryl-tRNA synthetase
MVADNIIALFGGTGIVLIAILTGYSFYQWAKNALPTAISEIKEVKDKQKDLKHELDITKKELNYVEKEVAALKVREEEHYNEQKKKIDLAFNILYKLEDLPKEFKELRNDLTAYFAKKQ